MTSEREAPESEPSDEDRRKAKARGWRQRIQELRSGGGRKQPPRSPREFTDRAASEAAQAEDEKIDPAPE
jgi:hypothetical protein